MIIFEPVVSIYVFHTLCLYIPKICMSFGIFQRPSPMDLLNLLYLLFFFVGYVDMLIFKVYIF